jgi:hypothetical protein
MNNLIMLNADRFCRLTLNELIAHKKSIFIVTLLFLVIQLLTPFYLKLDFEGYFPLLYIGGFIVSSLAFNELHNPQLAHQYLMLPCSNLEKFLSKWVLSSIGYALALLIVYYLFLMLDIALHSLIFKQSIPPSHITQATLWISILKYIILQSVIFLGAISFKKHTLLKTALLLACLVLALFIFSAFVSWIFLLDHSYGPIIISNIMHGLYFLFWVALAPVCLYVAYLKLTEYELRG